LDQTKTDGTRIGARLWRTAQTTSLLLGLGLVGALFVDPPASSSANYDQPKIVPAIGPWIKLGVDRSDAPRTAAVTPEDDLTAQSEEKKQGRPSRKPRSGVQLAKGSRVTLSEPVSGRV
jgi:hypothetical protein